MPSQADYEREIDEEKQVRDIERKAKEEEAKGNKDKASDEFAKAAKRWRRIGREYQEKDDADITDFEKAEYLCRAGEVMRKAAKDFERAAALAKDQKAADEYQEEANDCYKRAGWYFHRCGDKDMTLDNPGGAATSYAQADSCYLHWGHGAEKLDPTDPDVERAKDHRTRVQEDLEKAREKEREKAAEFHKKEGH